MAVPDYESIMLPLLALAGDGQEHTYRGAIDRLDVYKRQFLYCHICLFFDCAVVRFLWCLILPVFSLF